jgi:hypothetical protein
MEDCWAQRPSDRPSFADIISRLEKIDSTFSEVQIDLFVVFAARLTSTGTGTRVQSCRSDKVKAKVPVFFFFFPPFLIRLLWERRL